jgi:hypothetical protein
LLGDAAGREASFEIPINLMPITQSFDWARRHHPMPTKQRHTGEEGRSHRLPDDAILPFAIRQRLWDQLWQRLLSPPIEEGDRADPDPDTPRTGEGRR